MVEQDAVHREQSVRLSVIARHPVRVHLCRAVGRSRVERRLLTLRWRRRTEHLRRGRLIEAAFHPGKPNGFQQADGSHAGGVTRVHRFVEADAHVRLGRKVIHLVGIDGAEQGHQSGAVGEIAIVQEQSRVRVVPVDVEVIDPRRVERRSPADQPVDLIPLAEQQFGEVGAVLAGDSGDQRPLHRITASVGACSSPHFRHPIVAVSTPCYALAAAAGSPSA